MGNKKSYLSGLHVSDKTGSPDANQERCGGMTISSEHPRARTLQTRLDILPRIVSSWEAVTRTDHDIWRRRLKERLHVSA